ncbi:MAG: hypothetical protein M0026_02400 [Nocardiopsaceae bacterium]|nr:hypothetical protein [Nocardiopsaceae bacterium]
MSQQFAEDDPRHHTVRARQKFDELVTHLREDVGKVDDAQARALFETSAEVLIGLSTAFSHFEEGNEPAWRR